MPKEGIAAAGNWIVDRVKTIDRWPDQNTLASILCETAGNGGGPFNLLVDLTRMGASFPLAGAGLVGDDADGRWILETCRSLGIDTTRIDRAEAPTSYTDVMSLRGTGNRTFFHQRGANAFFGPGNLDISKLDAKILYLGYALLLDEMDKSDPRFGTQAGRVFAAAHEAGLKTALDVVSEDSYRFETVVAPTLKYVDWCFMNEFEAGRTVGLDLCPDGGLDCSAMELAGLKLLDKGVRDTVFLHAPEGALAMSRTERVWQPSVALPPAEIVGTVGAGDAFAAGVLYGLHEDQPLRQCLLNGVGAAAASLMHASASDGVLDLESCLALSAAHGFRS